MLSNFRDQFFLSEKDVSKIKLNENHKNILEIGFGNGENLINLSVKQPNDFFIGCDPYLNACTKILDNIVKKNIKNIKIWPDDINMIMKKLHENFFDLILILHPDPWPKKKHEKRRLIQQTFLDDIKNVLKTGGDLIISTDHEVMKCWILEQFHERHDFNCGKKNFMHVNNAPEWILNTKYTNKAIENNKVVNWFFFKKK